MATLDQPRTSPSRRSAITARRVLLACGIAYGVLYVFTSDVVAATLYDGYRRLDQAISELSATSAPTRTLLVAFLPVGTALLIAFGIGVWRAASGHRALRVTGGLLIGFGIIGVAWLPFPMSSRGDMVQGAAPATNDVGHLVLSALTVILIVAIIGSGAAGLPHLAFRVYSAFTLAAVLGFGALVGMTAPGWPRGCRRLGWACTSASVPTASWRVSRCSRSSSCEPSAGSAPHR